LKAAPDLTRANLPVGKNKAGKTCLLDAVEIATDGGDVVSLLQSVMWRRETSPAPVGQDDAG
jgi:recombinational DNA repair ATPase RecF